MYTRIGSKLLLLLEGLIEKEPHRVQWGSKFHLKHCSNYPSLKKGSREKSFIHLRYLEKVFPLRGG